MFYDVGILKPELHHYDFLTNKIIPQLKRAQVKHIPANFIQFHLRHSRQVLVYPLQNLLHHREFYQHFVFVKISQSYLFKWA